MARAAGGTLESCIQLPTERYPLPVMRSEATIERRSGRIGLEAEIMPDEETVEVTVLAR